jgi:hypothetical protein
MITREEFERLLTAYTDAYAKAILAKKGEEYRKAIEAAGDAKFALHAGVFPS